MATTVAQPETAIPAAGVAAVDSLATGQAVQQQQLPKEIVSQQQELQKDFLQLLRRPSHCTGMPCRPNPPGGALPPVLVKVAKMGPKNDLEVFLITSSVASRALGQAQLAYCNFDPEQVRDYSQVKAILDYPDISEETNQQCFRAEMYSKWACLQRVLQ
ncbi:unnamed protein product [Caretta caretta]